jgi:uncharacterized membrane-anchored protein YitT (DUF2179 family)
VLSAGVVFNSLLMLIGVLTVGLQKATGEVLPRYEIFNLPGVSTEVTAATQRPSGWRAWFRPSQRRQQLMALIITDRGPAVSERILRDMHRGVTALSGTGMYTGREHGVLLCALTVTEVAGLKTLVNNADPRAFVIVSPVQEILGSGFAPLQEEV